MGNNGQNGHSTNSIAWNKVDNKIDHTVDRHHDRFNKIKLIRKQERIKRLEVELRRLFMLLQKTTNPLTVAKLELQIRHVVRDLKQDGALVD